ncbi:aldo/keto reductase [Gulosibacter sp. 10]|uniref:aldo/keto reductase n=1 Tax=Gulosibacter sp. 10 TaxID=1255570 RepID=UPI000B34EE92|nr:aldo/keto reductase [Gulosibacter sp. 10]
MPSAGAAQPDGPGRPLGAFVLGGNVLGWTVPRDETPGLIDAFLSGGGVAVDVADNYTEWVESSTTGAAERAVGDWIAGSGRRADLHLSSKVGFSAVRPGLSRDNILAAFEESLERLRTDHLEVYYAHKDDPETDLLETLGTFHELKEQGLIGALGYSHISPDRFREAQALVREHGLTPITYLQHGYSIVNREAFERDFAGFEGVRFLAYHSLESGYLSGKYFENPGLVTDHTQKIRDRLDDPRSAGFQRNLHRVADRHGVPAAAIALAWFGAQEADIVPIASARDERQLAQLFFARGVRLSAEDLELLAW